MNRLMTGGYFVTVCLLFDGMAVWARLKRTACRCGSVLVNGLGRGQILVKRARIVLFQSKSHSSASSRQRTMGP